MHVKIQDKMGSQSLGRMQGNWDVQQETSAHTEHRLMYREELGDE